LVYSWTHQRLLNLLIKKWLLIHKAVKFACVIINERIRGWTRSLLSELLTFNLSFNFRFTVAILVLMIGFRFTLWHNLCASLLYFVVRAVRRRRQSSRSLSHLLMSFLFMNLIINLYFCSLDWSNIYVVRDFPDGFYKWDSAVELALYWECSYVIKNASLYSLSSMSIQHAGCQRSRSLLTINT